MELLYLSDLKATSYQELEEDILFEVEVLHPPERCIQCGFTELYKHDKRKQLPIRLKRVGLSVTRRRYKCRTCNTTFWEPVASFDEKRNMTKRLLEGIIRESMKTTFERKVRNERNPELKIFQKNALKRLIA